MRSSLRFLLVAAAVFLLLGRDQHVAVYADESSSATGNALRFEVHDNVAPPRVMAFRSEPVLLSEQGSNVLAAVFSPDGKHVTTVDAQGGVFRWDLVSGSSTKLREGAVNSPLCAAISLDGRLLAAVTPDNDLSLVPLDADNASLPLEQSNERTVALAFSADSKTLMAVSSGGNLSIWNTGTGKLKQRVLARPGPVQSVAVAPDGESVVIAAANDRAQSITLNPEGRADAIALSPTKTTAIAFSTDGTRLALGSADGTVRLLRTDDLENAIVLNGHTFAVWAIAFSPRNDMLATASWDGTMKLWDASTGQEFAKHKKHDESINVLAFAPDGYGLISAGLDGRLNYWAPDVPAILPETTIGRYPGQVWVATFSPDGRRLLTGGANHALVMWDLADRKQVWSGTSHEVTRCASFSPDGTLFATGGNGGKIDVWESGSGDKKGTLEGHPGAVSAVVFSPDGTMLISACDGKAIKHWDVASLTETHDWRGPKEQIYCAAISPDGRILVTGGGDWTSDVPGELALWNMADGLHLKVQAHRLAIWTTAFSPDGERLATASSDGIVKIWNVANRALERSLTYETWLRPLDFSPDGSKLAVGLGNGQIRLWSTSTWQEIVALQGHDSFTFHLEFSPDGQQIASAGEDGTIKLWSLQSVDSQE